jgi:hypothetical protein
MRHELFAVRIALRMEIIRETGWELRYSLVCESARLIEKEHHFNICRELMLIDSLNALLSSTPFRGRLTKPCGCTTKRQNDENPQNDDKNHFTYKSRYTLHHSSFSIRKRAFLPLQRHKIRHKLQLYYTGHPPGCQLKTRPNTFKYCFIRLTGRYTEQNGALGLDREKNRLGRWPN